MVGMAHFSKKGGESADDSSQIECRNRRLPFRKLTRHPLTTLQKPPPLLSGSTCPRPPPRPPIPAPARPPASLANPCAALRSSRGFHRLCEPGQTYVTRRACPPRSSPSPLLHLLQSLASPLGLGTVREFVLPESSAPLRHFTTSAATGAGSAGISSRQPGESQRDVRCGR